MSTFIIIIETCGHIAKLKVEADRIAYGGESLLLVEKGEPSPVAIINRDRMLTIVNAENVRGSELLIFDEE